MKKIFAILIILVQLVVFTGCANIESSSPKFLASGEPIAPNAITVTDVLDILNPILEDGGGVLLSEDNAEIIDFEAFEGDDDILYCFERDDVEMVIIVSRQAGGFFRAYFRPLVDDELAIDCMLSYAGVLLNALEPNEHQSMWEIVVPAIGVEGKSAQSSGEIWTLLYYEGKLDIMPKDM